MIKIFGQPFLQSRMSESKQMSTYMFTSIFWHDRYYGHVLFSQSPGTKLGILLEGYGVLGYQVFLLQALRSCPREAMIYLCDFGPVC